MRSSSGWPFLRPRSISRRVIKMPTPSASGARIAAIGPSKECRYTSLLRVPKCGPTFLLSSWDAFLQRLFSTFPNGWPGFGLLLVRLCLGVALIYLAAADIAAKSPAPMRLADDVIAATGGMFLIAGLWTPAIGTVIALDKVWSALSLYSPGDGTSTDLFLAILAASMAMLGPGAWSIDARLFGRKRFDIERAKRRPPL